MRQHRFAVWRCDTSRPWRSLIGCVLLRLGEAACDWLSGRSTDAWLRREKRAGRRKMMMMMTMIILVIIISQCESGMIFLLQMHHDDGCFSPPAHFWEGVQAR